MQTFLIWAATAFVAISAQKVSTNGRCGPDFQNRICQGSSFGDCCSQYGWCGSTSAYCRTGCQPKFGTCSGSGASSTIRSSSLRTSIIPNTPSSSVAPSSSRTSATAIASPSTPISKNGRCGYSNDAKRGFTCKGSGYGDCCSQYSYCGSTPAYCGTGCQPGFGTCSRVSSSVGLSSASSMRSSSASSSAQSSSASSSVVPVSSSTQISSSAASSSTTTSLVLSTIGSASSIGSSTSALSSAMSQSAISSTTPSSISVPSPSGTSAISASSTLDFSSVASSLASVSPSPISSIAAPVSSQSVIEITPTSVAEPVSSAISIQPSSTPPVASPLQIVVNPSFELGDGTNPTDWTVERFFVIDADATGRVQSNAHTGAYSVRGRGLPNGGFDVYLRQRVTVVPGASYKIEVFAKASTEGFCSVSIYLDDRAIRQYVPPAGTSYTPITAVVDIAAGDAVQPELLIDGACSLPDGNPVDYDLFIDDVTMTLVV